MISLTRLLRGVLILAVVAGCGGTKVVTTTTTPAAKFTDVKVYFLHNGKVQPVRRSVRVVQSAAAAAWGSLVAGPLPRESSWLSSDVVLAAGDDVAFSFDGTSVGLSTSPQDRLDFLKSSTH